MFAPTSTTVIPGRTKDRISWRSGASESLLYSEYIGGIYQGINNTRDSRDTTGCGSCHPIPYELHAGACEGEHREQQSALPPPRDVGFAVEPLTVSDRNLGDLEVELRGAEDEIEVAERVEVPEEGAVRRDSLVVLPPQHLGPAERVLDTAARAAR